MWVLALFSESFGEFEWFKIFLTSCERFGRVSRFCPEGSMTCVGDQFQRFQTRVAGAVTGSMGCHLAVGDTT